MAWKAVVPLVGKLKVFYEYACELEAVLPQLLHALCSGHLTPTEHLEQQQVSLILCNGTIFPWRININTI